MWGKWKFSEFEDLILDLLSRVFGFLLDNIEFIDFLMCLKNISEEVMVSLKVVEIIGVEIENVVVVYVFVAKRATILYFTLYNLVDIDLMY